MSEQIRFTKSEREAIRNWLLDYNNGVRVMDKILEDSVNTLPKEESAPSPDTSGDEE